MVENIAAQKTTDGVENGFTNYSNGKWTAAGDATVTIYKEDGSELLHETAKITQAAGA